MYVVIWGSESRSSSTILHSVVSNINGGRQQSISNKTHGVQYPTAFGVPMPFFQALFLDAGKSKYSISIDFVGPRRCVGYKAIPCSFPDFVFSFSTPKCE